MATIKPFAGVRPKKELAGRIAALPYDVYNRAEAKAEIHKEPLSFLAVDRAETQLADDVDTYDNRVYQKAGETLAQMLAEGLFFQDSTRCLYLYELTMNGKAQTGLVACASLDDYQNGIIKRHENTRASKEQDRIRHIDQCNAQTGPIFLTYRRENLIAAMMAEAKQQETIFSFTSPDGVRHRGWKISAEDNIQAFTEAFAKVPNLYIADGHHRAASAVKVGLKRRSEQPDYQGDEEFNYFLSVIFPGDELKILDYNRIVKDLNGLSKAAFLNELTRDFIVTSVPLPVVPDKKRNFGLYLEQQWYQLQLKGDTHSTSSSDRLDVAILQNKILAPLLGIKDPKTDQRIDFVGGIRGLKELERRVQSGWAAAFSLYPTTIEELFAVADEDQLMPPKSTWFEPKLRSGLFLHLLS